MRLRVWSVKSPVMLLLAVSLPVAAAGAQERVEIHRVPDRPTSDVAVCKVRWLDVRVMPVADSVKKPGTHALPLEFTNIGDTPCRIPSGMTMTFTPKEEFDLGADHDQPQGKFVVQPGKTVHRLFLWASQPTWAESCPVYDGFTMTSEEHEGWKIPPWLTVRHLWIHACSTGDTVVMPGPFVSGETVPRTQPRDSFVWPKKIEYTGLQLETLVPGPVLGMDVDLRLHGDSVAVGCPFDMLRRRLANGETVVDFNHCEDAASKTQDIVTLDLQRLDLLPAYTGGAAFELMGRVGDGEALSNVVDLEVMPSAMPALPVVEGILRKCGVADLAVGEQLVTLTGANRAGQVYEVTNKSATACAVAGVPEVKTLNLLQLNNGRHREEEFGMRVCGNCPDPLFAPRPNGWIDLKPGERAHFVVAYGTLKYPEIRDGGISWTRVTGLNFKLAGAVVRLPMSGPADEPLDVSSWRSGAYDGDPKNEHWTPPFAPTMQGLPPDCAKGFDSAEGHEKGITPVFLPPHNGVAFGLSLDEAKIAPGKIPLGTDLYASLWVDNQTDRAWTFDGCAGQLSPALAVWDSYGHRLADPTNVGGPPKAFMCSVPEQVTIGPHRCASGGVLAHVATSEMLAPGDYIVGEAPKLDKNGKPLTQSGLPMDGLHFTVLTEHAQPNLDSSDGK